MKENRYFDIFQSTRHLLYFVCVHDLKYDNTIQPTEKEIQPQHVPIIYKILVLNNDDNKTKLRPI